MTQLKSLTARQTCTDIYLQFLLLTAFRNAIPECACQLRGFILLSLNTFSTNSENLS